MLNLDILKGKLQTGLISSNISSSILFKILMSNLVDIKVNFSTSIIIELDITDHKSFTEGVDIPTDTLGIQAAIRYAAGQNEMWI